MRIARTISRLRSDVARFRATGRRVALVPTMGCLHEGHLALVRAAKRRARAVVVSIFVNPTQFGRGEDYSRYPRTERRDIALLRGEGVDEVFLPSVREMYRCDASVFVDEEGLSAGLCGAFRPGHFRGVLTVVSKLFNIVQPDAAVFGQKDIQQARLIEKMVEDLSFSTGIEIVPTVREKDGLAMSSRNRYLSGRERRGAVGVYKSLSAVATSFAGGERSSSRLSDVFSRSIAAHSLLRMQYFSVVDYRDMRPVKTVQGKCVAACAVFCGKTRLIDNIILE